MSFTRDDLPHVVLERYASKLSFANKATFDIGLKVKRDRQEYLLLSHYHPAPVKVNRWSFRLTPLHTQIECLPRILHAALHMVLLLKLEGGRNGLGRLAGDVFDYHVAFIRMTLLG